VANAEVLPGLRVGASRCAVNALLFKIPRLNKMVISRIRLFKLVLLAVLATHPLQWLRAQDLAPRAYLITPLHSNAVLQTYSFYDGSINFNSALAFSDAKGKYSVPIFSYYHSFGLFGCSVNVVAALPYGIGNFQGTATGAEQHLYRSGLIDSVYRLSVSLKGGPAMPPQEFVKLAAEGSARSRSESDRSDRSVRSHEAD
jgi:hypothetical protein